MRSDEELELLGFKQIRATDQLLEKHIEVEATGFYEFLAGVAHFLLGWNRRHVQPLVSLVQNLAEEMKLLESSLDFEGAVSISSDDGVNNMIFIRCHSRITD